MKKLFILIIAFFSTFLVSCEKDEIIVEKFENKNPKVKEISLNQLSNDKKFVTAFSKISKNHQINNAVSRTVMENQYNFTIDDYPAKVIELDSLTSYTFSINNETRTSSVFENLVVNHYTNGTTKAAIFKYFPNQNNTLNDSISVEHNSKYFEGRTEITPIIYNANNSSLRQTMVCITSNVLLCNYGGRTHPAGEKCGSTFWGTQTNCETIFTAPEFCTSIVQVIEDTGNNNGGATSVSVGMALADNFANTQLTPLQKLIYDSNPSIREYLANNVLIVPVPNYNPLLGGDSTMAVIDPNAIDFAEELIDLAMNNSLVTPFPLFQYPLNSNYTILYPNFTVLVKEYIPSLKTDQRLINTIHKLTNVNIQTIIDKLTWGNGPEINIVQLGNDPQGNEYHGKFNITEPDKIFIDIDLVNQLEQMSNISNPTQQQQQQLGMLNALVVFSVCLHEYVHYSDFAFDGSMQDNENLELGLLFEELFLGGYYEFSPNGNIVFIKAN